MLTIEALPLNATVSFDLYPSQVLGTGWKGAKVLAHIDAGSVPFFNVDPVATHINVYPFLPPSTPDRYDGYSWVKLQLADGQITCIGLPWIKDETLIVATTRKMKLAIDAVTPEQSDIIIRALSSNGFTAVDVEYVD